LFDCRVVMDGRSSLRYVVVLTVQVVLVPGAAKVKLMGASIFYALPTDEEHHRELLFTHSCVIEEAEDKSFFSNRLFPLTLFFRFPIPRFPHHTFYYAKLALQYYYQMLVGCEARYVVVNAFYTF
jgi:hypothetical protein